MSKDVLGPVTVGEVQGILSDFVQKVSGSNGRLWLREQKKFLRQEQCWSGPDAPNGGRIYILTIPVDGNRDWKAAVEAVGPDTGRNWSIWNVGDQYPPENRAGLREIILASFGPGSWTTGPQAVEWGQTHNLHPETPRAVFAVAEYRPLLYRELGAEAIGIVSTTPCSFEGLVQIPYVWLRGAERSADLDRFGHDWHDHYWFAFGRE